MRSYTATLHYSFSLARKVSSYYTLRQFGRSTVFCIILLVVGMGLALYYGYDFEFFQIAGLVVAASVALYFWYRHEVRRRWIVAMGAMGSPEAQLVITDESFTISSGAGSSTIPWRRFSRVWKQPDYWLLFLDKDHMPMTIPLEGIDWEILDMIDERIAKANKSQAPQSSPFKS